MMPYFAHDKDLEKCTATFTSSQQSRELEKSWEMRTEITGIPNGSEGLYDSKEDSFLLNSNKKWDLFSLLCL